MFAKRMFPYTMFACLVLGLFMTTATAQNIHPIQPTTVTHTDGITKLENDPESLSVDATALPNLTQPFAPLNNMQMSPIGQKLLSAVDARMGAPYVWGAAGPRVFDCSGFVWSVYQSVGVRFERTNARTFWSQFLPPREDEKFKFGTLVFFNNLQHVGIVADEHGFYHASRSHGVTYSPFNKYWLDRLDGFRTIPVPTQQVAE
jgi:peptidoglycan endopeptidase LytE